MTPYASPILTSLLDTDAYKLHMQQAVFHRYHHINVVAEFRCRGDELLATGQVEIACVDLGAMSPTPIPDSLLAALETLK